MREKGCGGLRSLSVSLPSRSQVWGFRRSVVALASWTTDLISGALSVYVDMVSRLLASGSYSESLHVLGCSMKRPLGKQKHLLLEAMLELPRRAKGQKKGLDNPKMFISRSIGT